ncbi:MAG: AAA family ATPase [Actinophytocola sp.]|uniref:helix-turn-helix transcriptional regulator n=1 Tax=Actinophytocola sp. TaxID=1872138 RepID=UPI003C72A280
MPSDACALVGREAEIHRLTGLVDLLASGSGQAILLEGEPGIGKSSLARVAVEAAEERGFGSYWAECDEIGQALPLQPLLDALLAGAMAEPRLDTIQRLLRGEVSSAADPAMAAAEQMLALMSELCSETPTVLVVDDLQWADLSTISVWEWLARSVDRTALLLIGILRPVPQRDELLAVRRVVGADNTFRLEGLHDEAVSELISTLSDGAPGTNLLRLAAEAAGNPLYLTELMDSLVRAQRLTVNESGAVEVTGGPVPGSLIGAISDRLDFLPKGVRNILQAAALLGNEFPVSDLAIVLGRRVGELVPAIDDARTARVLKDVGDKLAFRHPLIRAALYDDIAAPLRPAWHRDAARALAEAGVPTQRVARQLLQAISAPNPDPLDESLLNWTVDAAPTLVAQAPRTAIELLRQAASRTPASSTRGAVLVCRLAEALYRAGECAEAVQIATRALAVVEDPDLLVDLHWTVSQSRTMLGRPDEALEALEEAYELAEMSPQQRARLLVLTARAHRALGEVSVAGNVATKALAAAEEAGDKWALGWALHVMILVSTMRGEVAFTLPLFDRAIGVIGNAPELNDLGLLLQINKAIALGNLDRYDEALGTAARVRQLADRTGSLVRLAQAQSALGQLLFQVGRWDDATAEVETLTDDFKDPSASCCDRGIAAVIAFHRGDATAARRHLELAALRADQLGNRVVAPLILAHSLDREINDQPEEALAVLTARVGGDAEELDEVEDLLPEAARLAAFTGDFGAAADVADQAATLARRSTVPHRLGTAAYCRGLLDRDPFLLQQAADRYRDAGRPLLRAKALEAAAIGFAGQDEKDAARAAFTRADELYDQLGANWDLAHLRAHLRRFGIRRGPRAKHRQAQVGWSSLTPTETKIAAMVAEGMSNRQIAEQLVLSPRTVGTHVSHILAKLGVRSRIDIAREAAENVKAG